MDCAWVLYLLYVGRGISKHMVSQKESNDPILLGGEDPNYVQI